MTQTATLTQEDHNMQRLYRDLLAQGDIFTFADYSPLGEWLDIATDLYNAREKQGHKGVRAYIANLQKQDSQAYNKLVLLTSTDADTDIQETPKQVGILLSDVKPEPIRWLWKGRLARGKMTLLDGDPGLGKSLITLSLAARVSRGMTMPDGEQGIQGGVVLITPEDGLADTIQPRLARMGAYLTKIVSIGSVSVTDSDGNTYNRPFTLPTDLPLLKAAIERVKAILVIIDPVMAILGGQNTYKDNEVRTILTPVQMLIEEAGAAAILVRHLTKNGGENPLYRGGGSIAFIGLARLGLMVAKDPSDEEKCVLAPIKSNLNKGTANLTYTIVSDEEQGDDRPYIHWEGVNSCSIKELMTPPQKPGANRQEILRLLRKNAPKAMSPNEIWQVLSEDNPDLELNNVRTTLKRMRDAKQVESPAYGLYTISSSM